MHSLFAGLALTEVARLLYLVDTLSLASPGRTVHSARFLRRLGCI